MNSETCLSCEGIERYLGEEEERVHALRGVSLDIEPGSVHAVVGPSGCGKSSLLYILGLLDLPDAGRVSIESEPVSELSDDELAQRRSKFIGFIFQFHFLMEDFTAQENVMIPMRKLGQLSDNEMRERAAGFADVRVQILASADYGLLANKVATTVGTLITKNTYDQLGAIAVSNRKWAGMNPRAVYQAPFTLARKDGTTFQASATFSGLTAGSYTITAKDANGCTGTASATIVVPSQVLASATPVAVIAIRNKKPGMARRPIAALRAT